MPAKTPKRKVSDDSLVETDSDPQAKGKKSKQTATSHRPKQANSTKKAKSIKGMSGQEYLESLQPRIGTIDEADDFLIQNRFVLRGYRLNHNTWSKAFWSLFTIHNETVNVWSHFVGAIAFVFFFCYVGYWMQPPQIAEIDFVQQWTQQRFFDGSTTIPQFCLADEDNRQAVLLQESQCQDIRSDFFEQVLAEKWLRGYHEQGVEYKKYHYNLNYHQQAFERAEHFVRNAMKSFSEPKDRLSQCASCLKTFVQQLPDQLDSALETFYSQLAHYDPSSMSAENLTEQVNGFEFTDLSELSGYSGVMKTLKQIKFGAEDLMEPRNDFTGLLKSKISKLRGIVKDIRFRSAAWLQDTGSSEKPLFKPQESEEAINYVSRWPIFTYCIGAFIQMATSAYFHHFSCQSYEANDFLRRFDLAGISLMICGSCTPPYYYGFYCEEDTFWRRFYMIQVWTFCFVAAYYAILPRDPKDTKRQYKLAFSYLLAGYSCTPGLIHLTFYRDPRLNYDMKIWPWLLGGIFYAIGAILFAVKFPERIFKGWFDIWGSSHQLFHMFSLAAALLYFWAILREFHKRQLYPCPESYQLADNFNIN